MRLTPAAGGVAVDQPDADLAGPVRRYLGASFDLDGFAAAALADSVLARLVADLRGFRPPLVPDPFEALVTSITAQQISLRAAGAVRNRLIRAFGTAFAVAHAFPGRERLATASPEELVAVGFSRRKAEYVLGLARADVDLEGLAVLPDDEVKERLVALAGIGEWTAEWFLARHLGRPDVWPAGDLGLRKAVLHFYGTNDVRALGGRFAPFRTLAAHYLLLGMRAP